MLMMMFCCGRNPRWRCWNSGLL